MGIMQWKTVFFPSFVSFPIVPAKFVAGSSLLFRFMLALGDELCVCMLYFMSLIIFFVGLSCSIVFKSYI